MESNKSSRLSLPLGRTCTQQQGHTPPASNRLMINQLEFHWNVGSVEGNRHCTACLFSTAQPQHPPRLLPLSTAPATMLLSEKLFTAASHRRLRSGSCFELYFYVQAPKLYLALPAAQVAAAAL
jgi:hypothetical protein